MPSTEFQDDFRPDERIAAAAKAADSYAVAIIAAILMNNWDVPPETPKQGQQAARAVGRAVDLLAMSMSATGLLDGPGGTPNPYRYQSRQGTVLPMHLRPTRAGEPPRYA